MARKVTKKKHKTLPRGHNFRPLGRKMEVDYSNFPRGCRGAVMMRIMEERMELDEARRLIPDLEEQTHKVLMKMHTGEISSGGEDMVKKRMETIREIKEAVIGLKAQGLTYKQIEEQIGIKESTAKNYVNY